MKCSDHKSKYASTGKKLSELSNAAENYHAVLTENRKLFNELQELKGTEAHDNYCKLSKCHAA